MLAEWLSKEYRVDAMSLRDLGLRDAGDIEIFQAAQKAQAVVISKDSDFVELVSRHGSPPQLLWVTCGNVTNERLQAVFGNTFADA
jgi:predicted nuclease of predicted toxin-antitoxin system